MKHLASDFDQSKFHIRNKGRKKQSNLQNLEDIIKEENAIIKAEYVELDKIKDPNAKIWKIRSSILGPKHKAQEPTCINHPTTGELVANPEEIKRVKLEQNLKIKKINKKKLRIKS